jgi:peptidoglycan/LPS O-acetylase OafA/YrhL
MRKRSNSQFPRIRAFWHSLLTAKPVLNPSVTSSLCLNQLEKKDTTILKAIAILAIVFHNFFHIAVKVHENEFNFDPARFPVFLHTVVHPQLAIQAVFAFYGHFGVQIFIFLSAYGLARSHWDDESSWSSFMWSRIKKLYPMFGLVVLFWALLASMHLGPFWVIRDDGPSILLMFAGISNIIPRGGLPPVGPWWFIPFIMQCYAIWPLLRKLTRRFGWPALVVLCLICLIVTMAAYPVLARWSITLVMTPIARMRVFCLGIIAARYPIRINAYLAIPAFAMLILGSEYQGFAYLISLSSVIAFLWLYIKMRPLLRTSRALEQIGNYSLGIFLVNGVVRVPFVYFADTPFLQLTLAIASACVSLAISAFFHYLLAPPPKPTPKFAVPPLWMPVQSAEVSAE